MRLKSSNKFSLPFILTLGLLVVILFTLGGNKKPQKYPETPEFNQKTNLDLIQLTFSEKAFDKIEKKRLKALATGILETKDSDYVPATVAFNGKNFRAEVRLKGDWTDHLKGEKWSFRVKLKGDQTILGMRKFSIHHPQTRGFFYIAEWLYLKAIKREQLMGLRYAYVEGAIHIKEKNGSSYSNREVGLYALEETFDKRTIESNRGKESVILKFSEDNWWNEVKKSMEVGSSLGYKWEDFMNYKLVDKAKFPILPFSEEKTIQDSTMLKYFELGKNLLEDVYLGRSTIDKAFDVKKLAMQNAILNLFGATHGTYIINLRFYYNPITSRLEPIAFDGNSGLKLKKYEHFLFLDKKRDSIYLKELANALNIVSKPKYLSDLLAEYNDEMNSFKSTLKNEFHNKGLSVENLEYNQEIIKGELERLKSIYNLEDIIIENDDIEEIKIPDVKNWQNNNNLLVKTNYKNKNREVYRLSRNDVSANAYSVVTNNKINFGQVYQTSVIVKKGEDDNFFGLRLQGAYPNRIDAVFDLEKGKIKNQSTGGNFESVNATIKPLGNGWFLCGISGKIPTSNVKIIFGPTTAKKNSDAWEGLTNEKCDVFIIPSSLLIKRINK